MPDFIERVNWQEYAALLELGEPSIAVQLAIVNAGLLIYAVQRRARAAKTPQRNSWLLPMMFIACNTAVISFGDHLAIQI